MSEMTEPEPKPSAAATVLVVDDEPAVRAALERALRIERYDVRLAGDGTEALALLADRSPDAIVLDVAMPDVDGLEVCRRLRATGDRTPVLMLTARDSVDDRVAGLDAGADDYLVKPFALRELQARLRALLRRTEASRAGVLRFADLELDPVAREVRRGGREIELSRTEFNLLELFLEHPRQVLTRSQIFERVWGYDFGSTSNALGVYIGYLRRKTEAADEPRLLHTVRGVGYILRGTGDARPPPDPPLGACRRCDGRPRVRRRLHRHARGVARADRRLPARAGPRDPGPRRRRGPPTSPPPLPGEPRPTAGLASGFVQLVRSDGSADVLRGDDVRVPVTKADVVAASGNNTTAVLSDRTGDGVHLRVITVPLPGTRGDRVRPLAERRRRRPGPAALGVLLVLCVAGTGARRRREPRVRPPGHGPGGATSPRPPTTSRRPATSTGGSTARGRTSSAGSPGASTRCSTASARRRPRSAPRSSPSGA